MNETVRSRSGRANASAIRGHLAGPAGPRRSCQELGTSFRHTGNRRRISTTSTQVARYVPNNRGRAKRSSPHPRAAPRQPTRKTLQHAAAVRVGTRLPPEPGEADQVDAPLDPGARRSGTRAGGRRPGAGSRCSRGRTARTPGRSGCRAGRAGVATPRRRATMPSNRSDRMAGTRQAASHGPDSGSTQATATMTGPRARRNRVSPSGRATGGMGMAVRVRSWVPPNTLPAGRPVRLENPPVSPRSRPAGGAPARRGRFRRLPGPPAGQGLTVSLSRAGCAD